ncbi:MAG: gamma-glutamyl-gamma-aminobutyrate hydrolase family protein [Bacteroidetes bacterium]|nr:gamma-glutamyl-gamma-aminobutyrate hydrolase family protein [Bacteroidota bacterium]
MHLKIGITITEARYSNYPLWIKGDNSDIEIIQLSQTNSEDLKKCDGIVLSGGIDTHPKFYKNKCITYQFAPKEYDVARDEFELHVFKIAQEKNIPVLAVCRGMQLVNIALGGDLIQDIEESGKLDHRRHDKDGVHEITVVKDSLFYAVTGIASGTINSAHHQALGKIASDLKVSAFSPDGIAEAAEWKNKADKPFLLCVQYHPERLAQQQPENPFTRNIRNEFLKAVEQKTIKSKH